jgi:hypothetical protein
LLRFQREGLLPVERPPTPSHSVGQAAFPTKAGEEVTC